MDAHYKEEIHIEDLTQLSHLSETHVRRKFSEYMQITPGDYINFNYTGVSNNQNGWWRVENGKVNFNFNGIANNQNGWWYIRNGKVDFSKNGYIKVQGRYYQVVNGKIRT